MESLDLNNPEPKKVESLPEVSGLEYTRIPEEIFEQPEDDAIEELDGRLEQAEQLLGVEEVARIRRVVTSLYKPMKNMLTPVLENIKRGDYQLLIGDDASGRIPTLIVRKFINDAYKQSNQPGIKTRFLAGSTTHDDMKVRDSSKFERENKFLSENAKVSLREEKSRKIQNYVTELKENSPLRISGALIITEYIETGRGLAPLIKALQGDDITTTVLTAWILAPQHGIDSRKTNVGAVLHFGEGAMSSPSIYKNKDLSGVAKYFSDLHASPIRKSLPDTEKRAIMAKMTIARDEANHVADSLIAELLTSTKSEEYTQAE